MKPQIASVTSLRLTAELHRGRVVVVANNSVNVLLPASRFDALVTLVRCRHSKPRGYAKLCDFGCDRDSLHQTIRRLRQDFDAAFKSRVGGHLVRCVGRQTYLLSVETDAIEVDNDIGELAPEYLAACVAAELLRASEKCQYGASDLSVVPAYHPLPARLT